MQKRCELTEKEFKNIKTRIFLFFCAIWPALPQKKIKSKIFVYFSSSSSQISCLHSQNSILWLSIMLQAEIFLFLFADALRAMRRFEFNVCDAFKDFFFMTFDVWIYFLGMKIENLRKRKLNWKGRKNWKIKKKKKN